MSDPIENKIEDGLGALITFADFDDIQFEEFGITPPTFSNGGKTELTSLRNKKVKTFAPKRLTELEASTINVLYSTALLPQIWAMLGQNTLITFTWPDGSTESAWGFVDSFSRGELTPGERGEGTITIEFTCRDENDEEAEPAFA